MKNLLNTVTLDWLKAAAIRAVRTMAQTALGMLTIGAAVNEINWVQVLSVAFVAGIYSMLTSLSTSLPELPTDGTLQVDNSGVKDIYRLNITDDLATLSTKKTIVLKVTPATDLTIPETPSQ
jgi:hypothetical protein